MPFVASFESAEEVWVAPHLSARLNDKAQLLFEGKARPFADKREMALDIVLDGLDLTGVDQYAPPLKGISLLSGLLDTKLDVSFVQPGDAPASIRISGDVVLRNLERRQQGRSAVASSRASVWPCTWMASTPS